MILGAVTLTARKPHRCDHCGQTIEPGELYDRTRQIWEGEPNTFKAHVECRDAAMAYLDLVGDLDEGCRLSDDIQKEDWPWLLAEHPVVAGRLRIPGATA